MARRKPVELVYGKSGSGKTTWWIKLARHIFKTEGKKTRCYHGMGGEETIYAAIDQGEIPEEAIDVCDYTFLPNPLETSRFCCQGWWPNAMGVWEQAIPADVGFFVYEGLTPMSNYIMGSKEGGLADLAAKGNKLGQDSPFQIKQGKSTFGGNPPSHFGIAQRYILDFVEETRRLPGWVLWTAHETEADDKETSEKLVGPAVAGKALTSKIGGSFGNTIHLDVATKKVEEKDPTSGKTVNRLVTERRAYFTEHFDPDGISLKKYFANNRAFNPGRLPTRGYLTPPDPMEFYRLLSTAKDAK